MNSNTSYWAVRANQAGCEAATDEVLYSGLTRNEALATVDGCYSVADPADGYNFYAAPDNGTPGSLGTTGNDGDDDKMRNGRVRDADHGAGDDESRKEQLSLSSRTLLENLVQNDAVTSLLTWAVSLQAQNDEAGRWLEPDAVAVEAVMGHMRMATEAALRGLGRPRY
jgi:hypothetical protein